MKKDLTKIFIDEIESRPPKKTYPPDKLTYNHIDEIWSIDLAEFSDYKISNNKGFRYIFIIIENFSDYVWAIPLKNKNSKTITDEFSNTLTKSKRKLLKNESDREGEWYNCISQNFLKSKKFHRYSRFTNKRPSIAERAIRTIRNLSKKKIFLKGKADWLSE